MAGNGRLERLLSCRRPIQLTINADRARLAATSAQLAGERDVEDRGGDPQMLRNQGLELVAGTGTRRTSPAAPAGVLRQVPETIRDTSQPESHPAADAAGWSHTRRHRRCRCSDVFVAGVGQDPSGAKQAGIRAF
jgi:hypothetical protein